MVSDFKWNRDIIGKIVGDLRAISKELDGQRGDISEACAGILIANEKIEASCKEMEILIMDPATAQREWGVAKQKLQRISGIVSTDSEIGKILRGE